MDSKKKIIIVAAVVIVLIVAVFAAQSLSKDKDKDNDETATVTFLIQDNYGVYFWVDGDGKTVFDAFVDAADAFDLPFEASHADYGDGIQSLFGLKMDEKDGKWSWWQQFTYANGAWTSSSLTMEKLSAKDNEYFAVVYSDGSSTPAVTDVSKAAIWDWTFGDTLFTVESLSGMYFRVSGTGDTVFDAWDNAAKEYNIPYVPSESKYGKGITSIFGMEMISDESGYTYWTQFVEEKSKWIDSPLSMSNLKTADYAQMLLVYGNFYGDNHPEKAPIY